MPPTTGNPSNSVLQSVPPEARNTALIGALCTELEGAIRMREKAIARFDTLHEDRRKESEALMSEIETLVRCRDKALEELTRMRDTHTRELKEARASLEGATQERDAILRRVAELEEANQEQLKLLSEEQSAKKRPADREALTKERDAYKDAADKLLGQRTEAFRDRDKIAADLASENEKHREQIEELTQQREMAEAELQQLRKDIEALSLQVRQKQGEKPKRQRRSMEKQRDEIAAERDRLVAQLEELRSGHQEIVDRLTRERDELRQENIATTRDELRETLDVTIKAHRRELAALRQEHGAVANERDETRSLLEGDRLSWRKQVALFVQERDALTRERDECLMAAAQERQAQAKQIELRGEQCATLISQREELLSQLDHLREAQKRQHDLFAEERRILLQEKDALGARLDRALKSIGIDRTALLDQILDAQARIETMENEHRTVLQAMIHERDDAIEERDAATAQLAPFRSAQEREIATLGMLNTGKYELDGTASDHAAPHRLRVRDRVLEREIEMRFMDEWDSSGQARLEFMNEARRLGQLAHPNIPPIYDVGLDENGRPYYTTRAVTGMSLRSVLDQLEHGKTRSLLHFTLKRLVGVFHKACDAVAFAHAHGISHGALGPEHIILGDFGEVFVVRWDLRFQSSALFHGGPEIDVESDIMALGRLLHEIATLQPAPDSSNSRHGPTPVARQAAENQAHHWASQGNLGTLIGIARRAMDRRMVDQFRSVKEFQLRVDTFKDTFDDPKKLTLSRLLRQWIGAHKLLAVVLLAVFALASSSFAYLVTEKIIAYQAHWMKQHQR